MNLILLENHGRVKYWSFIEIIPAQGCAPEGLKDFKGFLEVAIESWRWPVWDMNPRPMNSV